jgi:hypothetical protein
MDHKAIDTSRERTPPLIQNPPWACNPTVSQETGEKKVEYPKSAILLEERGEVGRVGHQGVTVVVVRA